jgi:hypothetical protein
VFYSAPTSSENGRLQLISVYEAGVACPVFTQNPTAINRSNHALQKSMPF